MAFNVNTNVDKTGQQQDGTSVPVNPSANIFGTDANGQPLYQTMFMPKKPGSGFQSYTPTEVPRSGNVNTDFEHGFGNTPYPSTRAVDTTSPVARVVSPVNAFKDGMSQLNDPNAYHEDPTDPAGSAMKYIAGPPTEESYRKASTNAKKLGLVADALRHIGNIINTSNYAPAQKINSTFDYLDQRERLQNRQRQAEAQQQSENDYRNFKKVIAMADRENKAQQQASDNARKAEDLALKQHNSEREDKLAPYKQSYYEALAGGAKADEKTKTIKAANAKRESDDKHNESVERQKTQQNNRAVANKRVAIAEYNAHHKGKGGRSGSSSSSGSSKSSGSKGEGYWYYDKKGNYVHAKSEGAAKEGATANGTYVPAKYDKRGKETQHWYSRKPRPSIYQRPSQRKSPVKKNKGRGW